MAGKPRFVETFRGGGRKIKNCRIRVVVGRMGRWVVFPTQLMGFRHIRRPHGQVRVFVPLTCSLERTNQSVLGNLSGIGWDSAAVYYIFPESVKTTDTVSWKKCSIWIGLRITTWRWERYNGHCPRKRNCGFARQYDAQHAWTPTIEVWNAQWERIVRCATHGHTQSTCANTTC